MFRGFSLIMACAACLLSWTGARAATTANHKALQLGPVLQFLGNGSSDALSGSIRGYLVRSLPNTLYEASPGWGNTKKGVSAIKWKGQGFGVHPEVLRGDQNDGTWKKVRVSSDNLADTLIFDLRNLQRPQPGRITFDVFLSFDARVDYRQQNWRTGFKFYDGSVRASLRVRLNLKCDVTTRLEPNGTILPDAVIRFRFTSADLRYDHLVVEHINGVGGELAKLIGDAAKGAIRQWRPSLERELLAKANTAIVKAGNVKDVRVSLIKLLGQHSAPPAAKK